MSTCPEKDIHSVYLDGELPEEYRADYEAHVASCPACTATLEKMRSLHALFAADSSARTADGIYLEQSFSRLQTKLRYAATVEKAAPEKHVLAFPAARWALSAAAAAAVFAMIFTPAYLRSSAPNTEQELKAIASAELEPLANKSVVVDGNISHTDLPSLAVASASGAEASAASKDADRLVEQNTVRAQTVSTAGSHFRKSVQTMDVFKPDMLDAAASLPIRIEPPIPYYSGDKR